MGMECGITTLSFCTLSGGAGNLAHRLTLDLACTFSRPLLHRHFLSVSRTTSYFFLPAKSARYTASAALYSMGVLRLVSPTSASELLKIVNWRSTESPVRFSLVTCTCVPGTSPSAVASGVDPAAGDDPAAGAAELCAPAAP